MAVTKISPLPFEAFGIALNAATVAEIDPGPYSNTHTIRFYNPGPVGEDAWVSISPAVDTPASATITVSTTTPLVCDTITLDGNVLTAAGGPVVAGTDTFSVDVRAQATLTLNAATSYAVGDTITVTTKLGPPATTVVLTAIAGVRVPTTLTFQVIANAALQAAEIAIAVNDSGMAGACSAADVGNVVTFTASNSKKGTSGNASALSNQTDEGLGLETSSSIAGATTVVTFAGGVNADGGRTLQSGVVVYNERRDYLNNIAIAIADPTNSFAATFTTVHTPGSNPSSLIALAVAAGTAGNGLVLAAAAGGRITVTTPTAGGTDAIPTTLTAATSLVVPGGGGVVELHIGPEGDRNAVQPVAWWASPGANIGLFGMMSGGAGETLNVTYINGPGKS